MKYPDWKSIGKVRMSPSMRREWIEITAKKLHFSEMVCLPPCGGSGLKYNDGFFCRVWIKSPSMRREWIEIASLLSQYPIRIVSLHAEGVD